MLNHLADASIRSLLLALVAAIALWILRQRRTAALQHAVWTVVMCGMLALAVFGQALPRLPLHVRTATPLSEAGILDGTPAIASQASPPRAGTAKPIDWPFVALAAYGIIAFGFVAQFATGIFLVRRLRATARPAAGVFESDAIAVPFTVGWLRPRILLPSTWREWDGEKLDAVLAHEGAHARRHDGLVAALAGVNRCIFWFHPLAWILQRRLALLAEQACDEYCAAELGNRERYVQILLEMASVVDGSQGRLRYHAATMAARSHIHQRIEALLLQGRTFSRGLSRRGWVALTLSGVPVLLCAAGVELTFAQRGPAQSPVPKFDSVSIRTCAPGDGIGHTGRGGGGGGRGIPLSPPGELFINCMSVWEILNHSIEKSDPPLLNDSGGPFEKARVRGGPEWLYSDLYTIDAKSSHAAAAGLLVMSKTMSGPMLEALLESRFQLKIHREVEQIPMYSLVTASSGARLQPTPEGGCVPHEPGKPIGSKPECVTHTGWRGPNWTMDADGQEIRHLAGSLGGFVLDRPVLDKTGITGKFSFHLVFAHDQVAPGHLPSGMPSPFTSDSAAAPSLPVVLEQQLGLQLAPDQGPREYVVIDGAERPLLN